MVKSIWVGLVGLAFHLPVALSYPSNLQGSVQPEARDLQPDDWTLPWAVIGDSWGVSSPEITTSIVLLI